MTRSSINRLLESSRTPPRLGVVALILGLLVALASPALVRPVAASGPNLVVYVGYADNLRASGFFPNPWQGSPNVNFIGTGPTYDSGAIRIDNPSASAVTVDSVVVTIGGTNYNLWGANLNVPANGSLILAQTSGSQNFDTSDVSGAGNCTPSGVFPLVAVSVAGVSTTYVDTLQVLNTGGVDLAACPSGTNESQPWTLIGGGLTPPQVFGNGNPAAPQLPTCNSGSPVNCATGNFWETYDLLAIPGRGVPLDLQLTYNSLAAAQNSPVGFGWSFSYGMTLSKDPATGNMTIVQGNGSQVTFTASGGSYLAPPWALATLTANPDGTYTLLYQRTQQQDVFSATGQLLREVDRNGYTTTLTYTNNQLTSVTDPAGRGLAVTYGANGDVASVKDPAGRTVSFAYDGSGNLTTITDVNNGLTKFTYDGNHRLLTRTDPNSGVLTNVYDGAGRVTSQTDPLNRTTTFGYLAGTTTITDPKGNVTREHFSDLEPVAVTKGYNTPQEATWTYRYDVNGALGLVSVTDPNGHLSTNTWDSRGNLLSHTDALNHTTSFTYDSLDDLTSFTDPLSVATTYTYDAKGNVQSVSRPLTGTSSSFQLAFTYGDAQHPGDVTALTDANGKVWHFTYDNAGDRTAVADPLGDTTTFGYDAIGRRTSRVSPNGNVPGGNPAAFTTSYAYNAFGDLTKITDPVGGVTSLTYDGNRNLLTRTDPDTNLTQYGYDADNELTRVTRADGTIQTTGYDADGNVTSQTDGKNNTTGYTYDPINRLASIVDPLSRATSYSYDGAGNQTKLTDPSGRTITAGYDAANEVTGLTYSDGATPNVTFSYDADGQRTGMTDGTGSSSYVYDSLHRLTSATNGAGQKVLSAYDLMGNPTSLTYPGNQVVTRTYDAAGRLSSVADWLGHTTSFAYDADGNLTTQTYPNTTQAAFTYDAADRMLKVTASKGGSAFALLTYTRDAAGQLAAVNTGTYSYDAADNLTKLISGATIAYDAANQVTTFTQGGTPTSFSYDAQGNRLTGLTPSGSAASYAYDQANRLTKATVQGAATTYQYDGNGLRMHKTTGGTTSNFAWDDSQGIPLLLTDGSTLYVDGPGGVPIEQVSPSGDVLYLIADQLGSTRILTNPDGNEVAVYTYDAYGQTTLHDGTASTAFQFAGQYLDAGSGLYYLRARYYDPLTGQFLSRDPLVFATRAPYAYAAGDPLNLADPTGLDIVDLLAGQLAHRLIENAFMQQNPGFVNEQTLTGIGGTIRLDLVNYGTGAFYEIKPTTQAQAGTQQIARYVRWGLLNGVGLTPGGSVSDIRIEVLPNLLYLYATYSGTPGLIVYSWVLNAPLGFPVPIPFPRPWPRGQRPPTTVPIGVGVGAWCSVP